MERIINFVNSIVPNSMSNLWVNGYWFKWIDTQWKLIRTPKVTNEKKS